MAWSEVHASGACSVAGDGGKAVTTSTTINTGGSHVFVAIVSHYSGTAVAGDLTDTGSNTWTLLAAQTANGDANQQILIYYVLNPTTNASHSFTFNRGGNVTTPAMVVYAFTNTTATFVTSIGSGAGTTTAQAGSIGASGQLVVEALGWFQNNTMAIDSSFATPVEVGWSLNNNVGAAGSWKEVSGAVNPQWSWSGSNTVAAKAASFSSSGATRRKRLSLVGVGR